MAVLRYAPSVYRSTPVCPKACMLFMLGADGYSSRTASADESVRKRMRAPEGDLDRFQTAGGNFSCEEAGSRKNSPPFCANQGSPQISISGLGTGSQRRSGSAGSSGTENREASKVRREIIDDDYNTRSLARMVLFNHPSGAFDATKPNSTRKNPTASERQ